MVTRPTPRRPAWLYPTGSLLVLRDGRVFQVELVPTLYSEDPSYGHGGYEYEYVRYHREWRLVDHSASVRAAALDEAAVVAEADAAKWEIRWQDSDREESAVGRMYAAYRDTALALASAIRALKEEKK